MLPMANGVARIVKTSTGVVNMMKPVLKALIRGYQLLISPLLPATCRYTPTCSSYAITAIERFGPWRGSWMATRRIVRCNPWHQGGYDPVPEIPMVGQTDLMTLIDVNKSSDGGTSETGSEAASETAIDDDSLT